MARKPFLMGAEVEYSMSASTDRTSMVRESCHMRLLDAIRGEHQWLPDACSSAGIYIANGSRYYLDSGAHNEFSSPELSTPRQVAVYDRAAERILVRARDRVRSRPKGFDICITKNNINFNLPDRFAWGQHEAYTCWIRLDRAAHQIIPHLVSRIPYAGAGCLSAHKDGQGFELSQRARHMTRLTGRETTHDRAIFCTRAWKASDSSPTGWTRTNLISKDSQRCSFGTYLSYAVTGLLFAIMNEGHKIGRDVTLKDAVGAMRAFSLDPSLKTSVQLANGKRATAIDIQRAYLREARPYVENGDGPEWAHEALTHWEATLDQCETNPWALATRLDPYLKLAIFGRELNRAGIGWEELRDVLQVLERMRREAPEHVVRAVLHEDPRGLIQGHRATYQQLSDERRNHRVDLDRLRFAVRLQALELNYHELGGLFDEIEAAGLVDPVVVTHDEVESAIHNPPPGGRAEARSQSIVEFYGKPWYCDWQYLFCHDEKKWVDLRDPFDTRREVTELPAGFPFR